MKIKRILGIILCFSMLFSSAACNSAKKTSVVNDGKTVNVMMVGAGYGREWIDAVAEAFENTYADEGYKINVLDPSSSFQGSSALSEMRLGRDTGYDIVLTSGVTVQQATDAAYGVCVESLNELYESTALNFDGTDSGVKLKDMYRPSSKWQLAIGDDYWAFPYAGSVTGLVCNMKVLKKYGIEEKPVTTDELFEMFDTVLKGTESVAGMAPITWGGGNAYGYSLPVLYMGLAQMMGIDNYDEFFTMDYLLTADGKINPEGYKIVENEDLKKVLEVVIRAFDPVYSVKGSTTQKHDQANAQLITGKAAFMMNGEYYYNEIRKNFGSYVNDVDFITKPIITDLGVKLKLDGSGSDRAKCDKILSHMAKLVDESATEEQIKTSTEAAFEGITLSSEQISRVIEARRINYGGYSPCYIMKDTPVKDIATLFLRMLAGGDAAKVYLESGMMHPMSKAEVKESTPQFVKSASRINDTKDYQCSATLRPGTVRSKTNMFLIPPYNAMLPVTVASEIGIQDAADRDYGALTQTMYDKIVTNVKNNWASLMGQGGYAIA